MKTGLLIALLVAAIATFANASAASPPGTLTQVISPADGAPVVTSVRLAPVGLPNVTIDWSTLGFSEDDPTLYYDDAELADAGPGDSAALAAAAGHTTLVVDDDGADCPDATFTMIQPAVDAASPGDKIKVCRGTYVEQVTIPAGKDDLRLEGKPRLEAIIKAPAAMLDPKAIVRVNGAQDVKIKDFTITGPGSLGCDSIRWGVRVDAGGSAKIEHNHITLIQDTPFSGCQNGIAVLVGRNFEGQTGTAEIKHNTIDAYQKGGIVVDNTGSYAKIEKNIVEGVGPTAVTAQNGIQVSRGATADVKKNEISDNVYTPMTVTATGILLYQSGATDIEHNKVYDNDTGIDAFQADMTTIEKNGVVRSTYDGVTVDSSDGTEVDHNKTQGNDFGIGVYGTMNAMLDHNDAKDNGTYGFYADAFTSNNTFQDNKAKDSGMFDCRDDSTGGGTAFTANFWLHDRGDTSSPPGICEHH